MLYPSPARSALMQPLAMSQSPEIGPREANGQMSGLGIVAATEHLAMLVDPGQGLAVGKRHVKPHRAGAILQAVINQPEQRVAPLPGRCRQRNRLAVALRLVQQGFACARLQEIDLVQNLYQPVLGEM